MIGRPSRMVDSENSDSRRRWRVKDMHSLLYLSIACSSIVGFFPFKYDSRTYVFSKTRFAVSTIASLAYLAAVGYAAYMLNYMDFCHVELRCISMNLYLVLITASVVTTYATTRGRLNVLRKLSKLTRLLTRQDFNDLAKFVLTKDVIVVVYFAGFLVFYTVEWQMYPLLRIMNTYLLGVSIVGEMLYVNSVRLLGACFNKVNEHLKQLNEPSANRRPEFLRTKSLLYGQNTMLLMRVKHCEELHHEISDAVDLLNNVFREAIAIFTTSTFITITFNLYFTMQWISTKHLPGVSDSAERLLSFFFTIFMAAKFMVLIYVCETATNESTEITTTVHELAADCTDSAVRRELQYFARQIQHRDNKFSANAFTVNAKLLSQLTGAILMYTMIIFQFMLGANCSGPQFS